MTKADLAFEIALKSGIATETVKEVIEQFMTVVKDTLSQGEGIYMRGFGSFTLKERAEKTARNITKGTKVVIPAHSVPYFKPAPEFKEAVKEVKA